MVEITRPQGHKAGVCRRVTPSLRLVGDVRAALNAVGPDVRRAIASLPQTQYAMLAPRAS